MRNKVNFAGSGIGQSLDFESNRLLALSVIEPVKDKPLSLLKRRAGLAESTVL
jgi:hypothetical protein